MECLIKGCNFLLKNISDEAFTYVKHGNPEYDFQAVGSDPEIFPYLLVNIGSGVSILKVEADGQYERVGGTSMGGGTFWGLGSLLTKAKGFDELLQLAAKGDHRNIDMLVKDIYGGAYNRVGLASDVIASSFGRAARSAQERQYADFKSEDIAKSLLISISNDIGQLAYLHAKFHKLKKIYFGGFFIRGHPMTMQTISFAISFWSKGEIQALFLRHEGYLGAIGAFLKGAEEEEADKYSWIEDYAGSSGLQSPRTSKVPLRERKSTFDMLELHRFSNPLVNCPLLLDPSSYFPDVVDLTQDAAAREYWLQCFEEATDKFVERAIASQPDSVDASDRAAKFKDKYLQRLKEFKANPSAFGSLTVRSLLDTREHFLKESSFSDPYIQQKQFENEQALKHLEDHLKFLDSLSWQAKQLALVEGLLAGNVFDWGAKEVVNIMEEGQFGFTEARARLQARPWLVDNYEQWLERLKGPVHNCAVIFCDNSGIDIILGVFPFARELLSRGTKVILCANTMPALNDVTYSEVIILAKRVAAISETISRALAEERLVIMESGQASPCLDLRYISYDLSMKIRDMAADLIVLEGMGRSVHTNYSTAFSCEALKIAVLKNRWLANRLGGDMFSIIFKYEKPKRVVLRTHSLPAKFSVDSR
ncbi:pantothenate kinase 4 isoform X2 [Lingula anatina]|nr:pantothenate kinase 4 isoform X2 [Lingula anatina]XP_023931531.1 pantothenate kinase 4 isoform X2 [Lingula anatina]|eukprot:XP_023931530.1 pantothenate kinase 4 isoform X2 [Lingula anatina]